MAAAAHAAGAVVVADGAQFVPHPPADVAALGVGFLALLGHKMLGPDRHRRAVGGGELLEAMAPFLGGGGDDPRRALDGFTAEPAREFEAGTPPIAEAVGLDAAIGYLD